MIDIVALITTFGPIVLHLLSTAFNYWMYVQNGQQPPQNSQPKGN